MQKQNGMPDFLGNVIKRGLALGLLCVAPVAASAQSVSPAMTLTEVSNVLAQAATRARQVSPQSVIAVVDAEGFVLGVWSVSGAIEQTFDYTNRVFGNAIAKAGAASFLSSGQHAFTSRTAGFIVQQHFPPGVKNKAPGPLVGVNFSNLQFTDVNRFKNPHDGHAGTDSGTNGAAVPLPVTGGLGGTPGGVPLFRKGVLIGGVGVANPESDPTNITPDSIRDPGIDEDVAAAGQIGFAPAAEFFGSNVFIDGIRVPYINTLTQLGVIQPLFTSGTNLPGFELTNSPVVSYPTLLLGGQIGEVRQVIRDDPMAGQIDGVDRLNATDVASIIGLASERARTTRAGIRLPRGQPAQVFITVVNNPAINGVTPLVLGTFRTPNATLFSWDVAVQKARTAVFFSSATIAMSTRTVGFLAQSHYPPGIEGTPPGLFYGLQERFSMFPANLRNPLNGVIVTNTPAIDPNLTNGITIFPGGFPLYRHGVLIGAIGISGDGVDQDDIIGASGTQEFLAPDGIRADRFGYRGARLPYAKFPRNPAL
jgi:uncharacterized protein GlcG (DUF336 family)